MSQSAKDLESACAEAASGRRVLVRWRNHDLVVLPVEDLARLEDLEDAAEGRAALAEHQASGDAGVTAAELRQQLDAGA